MMSVMSEPSGWTDRQREAIDYFLEHGVPTFERKAASPSEASAEWIIDQLEDEARLDGRPLSDAELKLLRTSVLNLDDSLRPLAFALTNRLVPLTRRRIERAKAMGHVSTVKVRRGLVLPADWNEHYSRIYSTNFPWFVSGLMQAVMLNNVMAGERRPWQSK